MWPPHSEPSNNLLGHYRSPPPSHKSARVSCISRQSRGSHSTLDSLYKRSHPERRVPAHRIDLRPGASAHKQERMRRAGSRTAGKIHSKRPSCSSVWAAPGHRSERTSHWLSHHFSHIPQGHLCRMVGWASSSQVPHFLTSPSDNPVPLGPPMTHRPLWPCDLSLQLFLRIPQ